MSGKVWILGAAAVLFMPAIVQAQLTASDGFLSPVQDGKQSSRKFHGLKDCYNCHTNGFPKDGFGNQFGIMANDSWIRGDEAKIWGEDVDEAGNKADKHAQAYTSLLSETGEKIGKAMSPAVIAHRDKRCLACHTGYPITTMETEPGDVHGLIKADLYDTDLRLTAGVSCEGCHGAAGEWLVPHISKENWRFLSEEQKCEKGFTDVRSVISRTKLCLSCHLGNAREGRVLTHEMYAAGHPPLPAFEIETYEAAMPRHWRSLAEKGEDVRQEFLTKTGRQFQSDELSRSKTLLVSSLIARSESLRLTADLADRADGHVSSQITKPQWPDFAQFDCYACHHDLKTESWRQKVQHAGSPGRPVLTPWPDALLRISMQQSADATNLQQALAEVESATLAIPFGDDDKLIKASRHAADLAHEMAVALNSKALSQSEGRSILNRIIEAGATEVLDYDSARQLVWAYSLINYELGPKSSENSKETPFPDGLPEELRPIPLADELNSLKSVFVLDFKEAGRETEHTIPSAKKSRKVQEVDLSKVLPKIAKYDPAVFQAVFIELQKKSAP